MPSPRLDAPPTPGRNPNRAARTAARADGERSRQSILDAAERLLSERGYAGSGISRISRESGLPPSSIYWFFDTKQDLALAVIERAAERFFAEMEKPADQPAAHGFERMMRLALDRSEQRMPLFLRLTVQMSLELGASHPELRARLQRIRERARDLMEQSLAKPLADLGPQGPELARELSSLALALAEGTCIANEIDPAAVDLERAPADLRAAITAIASLRLDENPR